MSTKELGKLGEDIAADYLKKNGYQILERNYVPSWISQGKKEIDIVAKRKEILIFAEVKTSVKSPDFFPEGRVDFKKQKNLIKTAESYILEKKIKPETKWQIDVIAVEFAEDLKEHSIRHIENAVSDI